MSDLDWRVIRELAELRSRFRHVLEHALLRVTPSTAGSTSFEPAVDVFSSADAVIVEAELPGVPADAIRLRLEGNELVISGELAGAAEPSGQFLRVERPRGQFRRSVTLPFEVDGAPAATLRAGILEVRLPYASASRRRIAIIGGGAP